MAYKDNAYESFVARGWRDLVESLLRSPSDQLIGSGSTPSGTNVTNKETEINAALDALTNPETDIRVDLALVSTTLSVTLTGVAFGTYETD